MTTDAKSILKMIEENDASFVDFRFTDPRGKWQHTAQTSSSVDEKLLSLGGPGGGARRSIKKPKNPFK